MDGGLLHSIVKQVENYMRTLTADEAKAFYDKFDKRYTALRRMQIVVAGSYITSKGVSQ